MADQCEYEPVQDGEGKKKIEAMEEEEQVGLKASLGLMQGCTIIVGSIIGSGIFIAPGGVLRETGSVNMSLTIWILSGLYSMVGAYCYAELGCMIKRAGADYAYIMVTFGSFLAFVRCGLSGNCAKICIVDLDIGACCYVIYAPPLSAGCGWSV